MPKPQINRERDLAEVGDCVSHDLRAPIRAMSGFADLLESELGESLSDATTVYLGHILNGALRAQRLIDGVVRFIRLTPEAMTDVDLNVVARDALALQEHGRALDVRVGDLPTIHGTKGQLVALMTELIRNAGMFARRPDADLEIEIAAISTERARGFSIADNGPGIRTEDRERIFGLGARLHGEGEIAGDGIGLAVCRNISEFHGAELLVGDSSLGGARFSFEVPLEIP